MAENNGINYSQQSLAALTNSGLDEFFPELANYDSHDSTYSQPQDTVARHNPNQQHTLLGLGAQFEQASNSNSPFQLLDILSSDVAASFKNSNPSSSRLSGEYAPKPQETPGGMYSLSSDYGLGDHSGQLF